MIKCTVDKKLSEVNQNFPALHNFFSKNDMNKHLKTTAWAMVAFVIKDYKLVSY